jgi:hypothetical protein
MKNNYVLSYVEKTIRALSGYQLSEYQTYIYEDIDDEERRQSLYHLRRECSMISC